ncbi:MAG: hypothetical protein P4L74_02175 [Candidatus Doudnabacteria bacterium]|nr:hypothetical protein [Candidatus Doudnabacteria bacterium]
MSIIKSNIHMGDYPLNPDVPPDVIKERQNENFLPVSLQAVYPNEAGVLSSALATYKMRESEYFIHNRKTRSGTDQQIHYMSLTSEVRNLPSMRPSFLTVIAKICRISPELASQIDQILIDVASKLNLDPRILKSPQLNISAYNNYVLICRSANDKVRALVQNCLPDISALDLTDPESWSKLAAHYHHADQTPKESVTLLPESKNTLPNMQQAETVTPSVPDERHVSKPSSDLSKSKSPAPDTQPKITPEKFEEENFLPPCITAAYTQESLRLIKELANYKGQKSERYQYRRSYMQGESEKKSHYIAMQQEFPRLQSDPPFLLAIAKICRISPELSVQIDDILTKTANKLNVTAHWA